MKFLKNLLRNLFVRETIKTRKNRRKKKSFITIYYTRRFRKKLEGNVLQFPLKFWNVLDCEKGTQQKQSRVFHTVCAFILVLISNCPSGGFGGPGGGFRTGRSSGKPLLLPVLKKPPPGPPKPPLGQLEMSRIRNELWVII